MRCGYTILFLQRKLFLFPDLLHHRSQLIWWSRINVSTNVYSVVPQTSSRSSETCAKGVVCTDKIRTMPNPGFEPMTSSLANGNLATTHSIMFMRSLSFRLNEKAWSSGTSTSYKLLQRNGTISREDIMIMSGGLRYSALCVQCP